MKAVVWTLTISLFCSAYFFFQIYYRYRMLFNLFFVNSELNTWGIKDIDEDERYFLSKENLFYR